jgi:putative hydrolase of the HAD superfamily
VRTAVILDVGGVLLVPGEEIIDRALRRSGLLPDDALLSAAHYFAVHYVDDETKALTDRPYEIGYLSALGFAGDELAAGFKAFDELWKLPAIDLWSQQVPGGAELLARLSSANRPVAIVSNADGTVEESLRRQGLCQVGIGPSSTVAAIVDSAIVGFAKPDPRVFAPALAALRRVPKQCVYVGDTERFDVRGAEAAGIRPLHYDPHGLCRNPTAHSHLASLSDLWGLLD